ncbi:hypothetical protein [Rhizobium leguminosarum]|uniref:hypothetical protein n=1 Tax=Rhizobium leguminosarum TaxID=384 RepID=UPI001C98283A|nr:hypothetical protein [Rhizobium leguminosarum]MBY5797686.1 hypothetical protein [Rhizobium leguminosarum]
MARESEKPAVFRYLFDRRYNWHTDKFAPQTVTNDEIQDAILQLRSDEGLTLAAANPANFLKDFLRSPNRNIQWPQEIASVRYTARQSYSDGRVFDFVPYTEGQTVPFPDAFTLPIDPLIHRIETISLPSAARGFGRADAAWLVQVCVHQRVLQTHFALFSAIEVIDFFHLQNALKGTPEIDALFLMTFKAGSELHKALVTFEAKWDEPVLPDQIKSQVALMANRSTKEPGLRDIDFIIPVAAKTERLGAATVIAIFEMEAISVADGLAAYKTKSAHELPLSITGTVAYVLEPKAIGNSGT